MALGTPVAGAAAYSASGGTSVAPAYPAGILATDVVLLFVGQKPSTANGGTVTTPAGWTLREELTGAGGYGTTLGADTGNTNLRVYSWDTPIAGQTGTRSVTLGANGVSWAFIVRIPTGGGTISYGSADGQRTTTPTSPMSIALTNGATATNFQAGDKAIWAMCIPTDVTTPAQFSAQSITATGAVFATATELNEPDSTTGNDIGGYSAYAHVNSGASTTAPTVTATLAGTLTNVRGPVVLLRVREAQAISFDAQPGSFTLTGADATLLRTWNFDAQPGGFTLTGQAAELTYTPAQNAEIDAQPGTFTWSGQDATLQIARALNAAAGSLTLTGATATLLRTLKLDAQAAAFALTGQAADLIYGQPDPSLNAQPGTFSLTGQSAALSRSYVLNAQAGALADAPYADPDYVGPGYVGGVDAALNVGRALNAAAGTFNLAGLAATLTLGSIYPDPADVRAGVSFGPGGIYVGTMAAGKGTVWLRRR
jgi:hypothetical protein